MRLASNENLEVLRSSAVRRLVGADFASLLGDAAVLAVMPFAVISIGGDATDVGFVLAAQALGLAAMLPIGGVVGDRLNRLSVMVACDLVRLFSQAAVALLLLTGSATVWELLLAQGLHGLATAFFMPASAAVVPDVVAAEAIQPTNGLKVVSQGLAGAAGPAIGAIGVVAGGPGIAMAADAASFLVSATLLSGLARAPREASGKIGVEGLSGAAREALLLLGEGWRLFRGRTWLWSVTAEFLVVNALAVCPLFVLGPIVADRSYDGAGSWAVLLIALGLGRVTGGIVAIRWRPAFPLRAANLVFVAWGAPLVLLALGGPLPVVAAAALVGGVAGSVFDVLWDTTLQTQIPSAERARLSSFELCASFASVPLGFAVGGWLETLIGAEAALIAGVAVLLAATTSILLVPSVRRLRAADHGVGASPM